MIARGRIVADGSIADMTEGVDGGLEEVFKQLTLGAVPEPAGAPGLGDGEEEVAS